MYGGYGQAAWGRHQYGAPTSIVEPRYNESVPLDEAIGVSVTQWIVFTTYYYSSVPDFPDGITVEISEDNGVTYVPATTPTYETTKRVWDGQRYWIKIRKLLGTWPLSTYIYVRYTGTDEHGNAATKVVPVKWT
jgi:hypothetical protein